MPPLDLVLESGVAVYEWPVGQIHHRLTPLPAFTSEGNVAPFLVGSHSWATSGASVSRFDSAVAKRPAQYGQPLPLTL